MKVKGFTKEDKKTITAYEYEKSRDIIQAMREDESTPAEYVKMIADHIPGAYVDEIVTAEAKIATYANVWNAYDDESGHLDVMLEGLAKVYSEDGPAYIEIVGYLSDVWQFGGDGDENAAIMRRCGCWWYTR